MSLTAIEGIDDKGNITPKGWKVMGLKRVPEEGISDEKELLKSVEKELDQKCPVMAGVGTEYGLHYIVFRGKVGDKYHFWNPADEEPKDKEWADGKLGKYSLRTIRIYRGPVASFTYSPYPPYLPIGLFY